MRIAIICSCAEPDRDGVGDYVAMLASGLVASGHNVAILAINDKYVYRRCDGLVIDGPSISVLRLPRAWPWTAKVGSARLWLESFGPDWISLQYVPYGYHPRGLCFQLGKYIRAAAGQIPVHLMLHELWIFPWLRRKVTDRLTGILQRWALKKILHDLRPAAISTQNNFYRDVLSANKIAAEVIRLHSNISFVDSTQALAEFKARHYLHGVNSTGTQIMNAGFFGAIQQDVDGLPMLQKLANAATADGKQLLVCSAGQIGDRGLEVWNRWKHTPNQKIEFRLLGRLSNEEVSFYLQSLTFGVTTYTTEFVEKSGAVAACLEHGLTVVLAQEKYLGEAYAASSPLVVVHPGWSRSRIDPSELWRRSVKCSGPSTPGARQTAALLVSALKGV